MLGTKATIEKFWNIDYTVTSRTLQPFTQNAVSVLNSYVGCKFPQAFVPNVQVDISAITCDLLHVNAVGAVCRSPSFSLSLSRVMTCGNSDSSLRGCLKCPIIYDVVRRDSSILFIGNRYPGQPPQYVAPCIPVCRPSTFDHFSLNKVGTLSLLLLLLLLLQLLRAIPSTSSAHHTE